MTCPTCKRPVDWNADSPWRPFCSERCKLIDLGAWASERHAISGDIQQLADDDPANSETFSEPPDETRR